RDESSSAPILVNGVAVQKVDVVYVGVDFQRIDDINLSAQEFAMEGFLWLKWQNENLALRAKDKFVMFWNGMLGSYDKLYVLCERLDGDVKHIAYRLGGKFKTEYNLKQFPFDTQVLTVDLSIPQYGTDKVLLVADRAYLRSSQDMAGEGVVPAGYKLVGIDHFSGTKPFDSSLGHGREGDHRPDFSVYQASMIVERVSFPYFLKVLLPLFILTGVSLTAYFVPQGVLQVRTSLGLTTLLSAIVLHLSRTQSLPNIGYLTRVDYGFVFAYIFMTFNIVASIFGERLARSRSPEHAAVFNRTIGLLIATNILIVFILIMITGINIDWSVWVTCLNLVVISGCLLRQRHQRIRLTST
ncbi:MAG: hypothetical protein HQK60_16760, partial [Deltaproteobacteria bacterium]|nr:hypothetical protein [Deltaproteobacteria bacterium]